MKIAILGAGWLGCHLAKFLLNNEHQPIITLELEIYEQADHIFAGSSGKNQNRHHLGFHYARSYHTRKICQQYFKRFQEEYQFGLHNLDQCHYLISKDSVLDCQTYLSIFEQEKYDYKILNHYQSNYQNLDALLEVPEQYIDHQKIGKYFTQLLQSYIYLNSPIEPQHLKQNPTTGKWILNNQEYDLIIDTTNQGLNLLENQEFYAEETISFLYQSKLNHTLGITVVDGDFPSLYPYDLENDLYTLNHVTYTPLRQHNKTDEEPINEEELDQIRCHMETEILKYYPEFKNHFSHRGRFFSKKVKRQSGCDWRGFFGEVHNNLINLVTTKIIGIYQAEKFLRDIIDKMNQNNKIALIGSTGFIGTNLQKQIKFTHLYHSQNIHEIRNQSFQKILFCGLPAQKWWINQHPEEDLQNIQQLEDHLKTTTAEEFILISTIDIYPPTQLTNHIPNQTQKLNEDTVIHPDDHPQPYGRHRLIFENIISSMTPQNFKKTYILRLPGLFGLGLKKNVIFDLLLKRTDYPINLKSKFQWYDVSYLAEDIETITTQQNSNQQMTNNQVTVVNLFSEPIETELIIQKFFPRQSLNLTTNNTANYQFQTKHEHLFNRTFIYQNQQHIRMSSNYYCFQEKIMKRLNQFITLSKRYPVLNLNDDLKSLYTQSNDPTDHLVVSNLAWDQKDEDFALELLKSYGINNLEIAPAKVFGSNENIDFHDLLAYRQKLNARGFNIYSLQAILYQVNDTEIFKSQYTQSRFIQQVKSSIKYAKVLGAERIVIGGPKNRKLHNKTYQECYQEAIQVFTELANYAQETDPEIILVLEPNPKSYQCEFANTSHLALDLVQEINHPNFQLHLDIGCLWVGGELPVQSTLEKIFNINSNLVKHIHISADALQPICDEPNINYHQHLTYLSHLSKENKYQHKISLEMVNSSLPKLNRSLQIFLSDK